MTVFIDTSAIYALLDADDANHKAAANWLSGPGRDQDLLTHNYFDQLLPTIDVAFVEEGLHRRRSLGRLF